MTAILDSQAEMLRRAGPNAERLRRWEDRMAMPLVLAAVLPIGIALTGNRSLATDLVMVVSWLVFVVDLIVHVRLVPGYLGTGYGIFDLVIVVLSAPWFLIPGGSDSAILQLSKLARVGRLLFVTRAGRELLARAGRVGLWALGSWLILSWIAFQAERDVNTEFATYGDALWWGVVTITTVGYGDITPVTADGRITAALLMLSGLALLGSLAGILASFFRLSGGPDETATPARDGG